MSRYLAIDLETGTILDAGTVVVVDYYDLTTREQEIIDESNNDDAIWNIGKQKGRRVLTVKEQENDR